MTAKKILEGEIENLKISSLPTRPTAPIAFGGKGYTTKEMKEAFDRLPLLVIERYNSLLNDISDGSLAEEISVHGTTLSLYLKSLRDDLDALIGRGTE